MARKTRMSVRMIAALLSGMVDDGERVVGGRCGRWFVAL